MTSPPSPRSFPSSCGTSSKVLFVFVSVVRCPGETERAGCWQQQHRVRSGRLRGASSVPLSRSSCAPCALVLCDSSPGHVQKGSQVLSPHSPACLQHSITGRAGFSSSPGEHCSFTYKLQCPAAHCLNCMEECASLLEQLGDCCRPEWMDVRSHGTLAPIELTS